MLNIHLGKAIDWAAGNPTAVQRAAEEFFGSGKQNLPVEYQERIISLFNEWFVFDFVDAAKQSIIKEYYLINPDGLSAGLMDELSQVIETQLYGYFEVQKIKPGEWVEVWELCTGRSYRVSEISLSRNLKNQKGSFFNRRAKVNGDYYFIGSDPVVFPMTYTERAKKDFSSGGNDLKLTPKTLLKLLVSQANKKDPAILCSAKVVRSKRLELEREFERLTRKYKITAVFGDLTDFVYNESYTSHFADFYRDVKITGVTEETIFGETQFFQDLWNYFPHKKLNGKSPAERVREYYGKQSFF